MSSKDQEVDVKRKRSLKKESSPTRGGGDAKRSKPASNDVRLFYAEEKEVEDRDPQKDLSLFKSTTADIRKCFKDIRDAKDKGGKLSNEVIETKKRETALHFVLLKKLNRLSHIRCKKARDATNEAKQRIDQYHLQLQNLLYETMHLEKEITKCLEFKSKDEEIELVPVGEFYEDAPDDILSKVESNKKDPHQLRLARLDWELEQRKMLAQKLKESETNKDHLDKEIKTQQEYLENLQPKLNSILESTKPVQEYLGMPFDQIREQHQIAGHLPHPLYVLYMQTDAYRQACDKKLEVKIEGDIEAAKSLKRTPQMLADVDDSDSDQEEQEKKQSKRRRKTIDSGKIERINKVLMKHPLSVVLKIKTKDGTCLQLTFWYLVTLEIVTVGIQLKTGTDSPPSCISGGDLLSPDLLLNEIYPGDTGSCSPNAANQYELRRLGLGDFNQYIKDIGRPYLWAQWMSGLQFLNNKSSKVAESNVSMENMQETIKLLRRRIKSRLSLLKQLSSLERGIVPLAPEAMALFPTKIVAKLSSWKRSTYSDFCALEHTVDVIENGMAKESDIFFIAVLERGSAKLSAQIVVTPDYPAVAPLVIVSLQWQTERTALSDINIQDMEEEVNVHYKEMVIGKSHDQILTNQLQRLMMCFDVYLETETQSAEEGPKEISKEKVYARLNRGPNRTKPYRFCPEVGIFSHR